MSMGPAKVKMSEPCSVYFGNVCTGFGNDDQTCLMCGWERNEHPEESEKMRNLLAACKQMQEVAEVVSHEQ